MALPETNITTTIVRNAIGAASSSIGDLRKSSLNNWWGFSSVQRGWADQSPSSHFKLGDYRGYDHTFRCWSFEAAFQSATEWGELLSFTIGLHKFPVWSIQDDADHLFDILFKRTSNFEQGGYTVFASNVTMNNQTSYTFTMNPSSPPDGGDAIEDGATFYLAIVHTSSPALKWDDNKWFGTPAGQLGGNNYALIEATTPVDLCNYYVYQYAQTASMYFASPTQRGIIGSFDIMIDVRANLTVYAQIEFCKSSGFDVDVQTLGPSALLIKNSSTGTYEQRTISYNGTPSTLFGVGDTVYYRSKITRVSDSNVTHSTNYTNIKSLVVSNQLPL
ncbi:hypothetical protein C8N47_11172 [Mangrovibacterium marinum]|uniref:Uncharacterized protein n=1 Tax=Mangrovibacterium marinum TaxID=1639118 RepID=A0A2T5C0D6_9BACT|nr:hypothetical protein [Mangrovibacterium marinum]PTN08032.1 hypothetical protein C8N47_11172 [Mangrovibacterium marinum]